jgi:hypothetical protein
MKARCTTCIHGAAWRVCIRGTNRKGRPRAAHYGAWPRRCDAYVPRWPPLTPDDVRRALAAEGLNDAIAQITCIDGRPAVRYHRHANIDVQNRVARVLRELSARHRKAGR